MIHRENLGHLSEEADVTLFSIREGQFGFMDHTGGEKMMGDRKLETQMTIRAGQVVWDLNGLAVEEYVPEN